MAAETLSIEAWSQTGAAILGRIINPDDPSWTPEAARSILALAFAKSDQERVAALLEKNQEGRLGPAERAELDEYLRADAFLTILRSKARRSLKSHGLQP